MSFRSALLLARRAASTSRIRSSPRSCHIPFIPLRSRLITSSAHLLFTPMAAPESTAAHSLTPETLTSTLQSKLKTTHVSIEDMSGGCGQAFNAVIVSPDFEGKTLLARHRLVNAALKDEIAAIHAWTPRCLTVAQWEKEKGLGGT